MASSTQLKGIELISCAQASAEQGLATAARQCGYGNNIILFQKNLTQAGRQIGIKLDNMSNLTVSPTKIRKRGEVKINLDCVARPKGDRVY
ncbi:MAG: hypothetical protein ACRC2R_25285 [Xenococcaceae cyanobacterium]